MVDVTETDDGPNFDWCIRIWAGNLNDDIDPSFLSFIIGLPQKMWIISKTSVQMLEVWECANIKNILAKI